MQKKMRSGTILCVIVLSLLITPFAIGGYNAYAEASNVVETDSQLYETNPDDEADIVEHNELEGKALQPPHEDVMLPATYTDDDLESLILEMQQQLDELQAQMQDLQMNVDFLWNSLLGGQPDEAALISQTAQIAATERFVFKIEYYNACALLSSSYLLKHHIALVERELEVERVRLWLGEVTQTSVDVLLAQLTGLRTQSESKREEFRARQQLIDGKRGLPGYDFIGNYTIPTPLIPQVQTLEALKATLLGNNASLDALDRQIEQQNEIIDALIDAGAETGIINAYRAELEHTTAERGLLVSRLTTTAASRWFSYLDAKAQFDLAEAMRPMLNAQLELISTLHDLGEISTAEKLRQELSIYEELHKADMSAVALAIEAAQLDIMADGIIV